MGRYRGAKYPGMTGGNAIIRGARAAAGRGRRKMGGRRRSLGRTIWQDSGGRVASGRPVRRSKRTGRFVRG